MLSSVNLQDTKINKFDIEIPCLTSPCAFILLDFENDVHLPIYSDLIEGYHCKSIFVSSDFLDRTNYTFDTIFGAISNCETYKDYQILVHIINVDSNEIFIHPLNINKHSIIGQKVLHDWMAPVVKDLLKNIDEIEIVFTKQASTYRSSDALNTFLDSINYSLLIDGEYSTIKHESKYFYEHQTKNFNLTIPHKLYRKTDSDGNFIKEQLLIHLNDISYTNIFVKPNIKASFIRNNEINTQGGNFLGFNSNER